MFFFYCHGKFLKTCQNNVFFFYCHGKFLKTYQNNVFYYFFFRAWQHLYFPARAVRYIKVVGTHNTVNRVFHLVALEAYFTKQKISLHEGLIGESYHKLTGGLPLFYLFSFIFKNISTPWIFHYQGIHIKLFNDYFLMISSFQIILNNLKA